MRRGEVWLTNFAPSSGAESNKTRPAVIVSNDTANITAERLGRGVVTVVPITSNVSNVFPFQVFLSATATGLNRDSKAHAEQVRSIDAGRVSRRIGSLNFESLEQLDEALRIHLAL